MMSIYYYTEPQNYLRDSYVAKKKGNTSFTIRAWAQNMGMKSHSSLYQMIEGKRPIPKRYIPHLIESLELTPREGMYFENIIELKRARTEREKEVYLKRIKDLSPLKFPKVFAVDSFKALSHPIHTILLEMTCLADFVADPRWIKKRLAFDFTEKEIRTALERLKELELLYTTPLGQLKKTHRHLNSQADIKDLGLQAFHKSVSTMAQEAIETQSVQERQFNAYSFCMKRSSLPTAKKMIREFAFHLMNTLETEETQGEELYHMNLQLFKLTQKGV